MIPIAAAVIAFLFFAVTVQNIGLSLICGITVGVIVWALTGFKVGGAVPSLKPITDVAEEELVRRLKDPSTSPDDLKVVQAEIIKRQQAYEEKQAQQFEAVAGVVDTGNVITELAFEAAGAGNSEVQELIGISYLSGTNGLPNDFRKAHQYLLMAATQNRAASCYFVALIYAEGMGMPKDLDQARLWANRAKAMGHAQADQALRTIDHLQKGGTF